MLSKTAEQKDITKLRGQFNKFEMANPAVTDVYRICDKLKRSDKTHVATPHATTPAKWLVSECFDLLFVCGLAPWFLGAVAFVCTGGLINTPIASPEQQVLTMFLVGASFLIGESHQFTSILRYYSKTFRQRSKRYRWHRIPIWILYSILVTAALAFASDSFSRFMPILLVPSTLIVSLLSIPLTVLSIFMVTFFPVFLMQHFCAQAKAVGLAYCTNNNFYLSSLEKMALSVVSWLLVLAGVITIAAPFSSFGGMINTPPSLIEQLIKADSPAHSISIMVTHYAVVFLGIHFVVRGIKNNEWLPIGAALTWVNMALFTLIPANWMLYIWLFVPVFFHASQHWAIAWNTLQREDMQTRIRDQQSDESSEWDRGQNNSNGLRFRTERALELPVFYSNFRRLVLPVQVSSVVVLFGALIWQRLWGNPIVNGTDATLGVLFSILVFYGHYFTDRIVWRPTDEIRR